ncbi:DUF6470 family protein [Neobacillus sp. OS1-2]|uniref:DUF6470 family protein n=1 Tax=Neobacillus sp. OS1-2 TaxID=3070680 RepID=UPI0027E1DD76|nr:DUF6470 family protein [Neobacillus sp. OS1-2]WML39374.1 DUF6470 family protein [Neobacillus sp. OS1-2]
MQLPQIRLQQTYAQIGLRITQPVQEIHQAPANLSIKQIPAELSIEKKAARLEIDQIEAWNQLGFKNLNVLADEWAEDGKQACLEAIGQIAEEGDQMAAIQNKSDAFAAIALQRSTPPPTNFNITFIPSYGSVKIQFTPTELYMDWKRGGAEIEATPSQSIHEYTPGKTEVYLRQMQQLEIDFVGTNINDKG